jgi:hypothetical protein
VRRCIVGEEEERKAPQRRALRRMLRGSRR